MAQTIQIPAQVQFSAIPMRWTRGVAEFIGWTDTPHGGPVGVYRIAGSEPYSGITEKITRGRLPGNLRSRVPQFSPKRFSDTLRMDPDPVQIDILICDWHKPLQLLDSPVPEKKAFDGWQMRSDFLRVGDDLDALAAFLSKYGDWGHQYGMANVFWAQKGDKRLRARIISPEDILLGIDHSEPTSRKFGPFVRRQGMRMVALDSIIRWGLTCEPDEWFASKYAELGLRGPKPKFPHFLIEPYGIHGALFATVTIDHLSGTKYQACARPDCGMPFALESKHRRLYCTQYCAHLESVRKSRRAAKSERES